MKLLHTADWHLGKSLYDFSLLEDQRHMLNSLLALLEGERFDALLLAGDIYDRPVPPAQAVRLYDEFLTRAAGELRVPVLAVAGNHDSPSRLEFGSSLTAGSGYYVAGQVREEIRRVTLKDGYGPVEFWLLPFLHPADVRALFPDEPVKTCDDAYRVLIGKNLPGLDPSRRNVAVAHGFFSAIGSGKTLLTSESEVNIGGLDIADSGIFSSFDYTALGHLHAPQRAGAETIRYGGSPLKYSLSEERQKKSFTVVELGPKGEVAVSFREAGALRDVRTVQGSLEELLEPSFHQNDRFDDYVFALLTDSGALYPMEKLRKLFPHLLGLRLSGAGEGDLRELKAGGRMPKLSPEEMFRRFYRETRGHDMPSEAADFLRETIALLEREGGREVEPV